MRETYLSRQVRGLFVDDGSSFFQQDRPGARPAVPPSLGAGVSRPVAFPGFAKPHTDFQAVRDGRRSTLQGFLVDLSSARSFAAGTALLLDCQGNVFFADPLFDLTGNSLAGIARVHFQDENINPVGTYVTALPSAIYKLPFTRLAVENFAQPGKFLYIVYGTDVDLQPGASQQVQATILNLAQVLADGGINFLRVAVQGHGDPDTDNGNAFTGYSAQAAVAAQYSYWQIKNPAASGKTVYVDKLNFSTPANDQVGLALYNTDLANLTGAQQNKKSGGAAPVSQIRTAASATAAGPDGSALFCAYIATLANANMEHVFDPPIRLDAGKGIIARGQTLNQLFTCSAEWREY